MRFKSLSPDQWFLLLTFTQRPKNHSHVPAVLLGPHFNVAVFCNVCCQSLEQSVTQLRTRLLAATEHDGHLNFGSLLQEANHVALFSLIVVVIDLGAELLLLDHSLLLVLPRLAGFLGLLVFELAVVHDFGDGRLSRRRNLNQVKVCVKSQLASIVRANDAYLLATWADKTDLRNSDALINSSISFSGNV